MAEAFPTASPDIMREESGPDAVPSPGRRAWMTAAILAGLFLGSAAIETAYACWTRGAWGPDQLDADEQEYYHLAGSWLRRAPDLGPRRTIGHVLIVAAARIATGDRLLLTQVLISLLFSFTAPISYLLARRELGSHRAAMLGGLCVMLWPLYVVYGATLYSEPTALPFFAALLLAIPGLLGSGQVRAGRWFGAGAMLGLCMHIRPMYMIYSPIAAAIAYQRSPRGLRGLLSVAALTGGCLAVVLPWSIYLSLREHTPILLTSVGGETLGGGMNPGLLRKEAEGRTTVIAPGGRVTWTGPGKWLTIQETDLLSPDELKLPYTETSRLLGERSTAWIRGHPRDAAYLLARKWSYMWGIYPFWNGWRQTLFGNIPTLLLLPAGAIALFAYRRELGALSLLWTLPLFVTAVAVISWGSWRFRMPGDLGPLLMVASLPYREEVRRFLASAADAVRRRASGR